MGTDCPSNIFKHFSAVPTLRNPVEALNPMIREQFDLSAREIEVACQKAE